MEFEMKTTNSLNLPEILLKGMISTILIMLAVTALLFIAPKVVQLLIMTGGIDVRKAQNIGFGSVSIIILVIGPIGILSHLFFLMRKIIPMDEEDARASTVEQIATGLIVLICYVVWTYWLALDFIFKQAGIRFL